MSELAIYTDGGSRGNPGPSAIGGVMYLDDIEINSFSHFIGVKTNNEAEYQAFSFSLEWFSKQNPDYSSVTWYLDSKLVVEQLNGNWKVKEPRLKVIVDNIKKSLKEISIPYKIVHVLREKNSEADSLVNQALDAHQLQ